MLHVSIEHVEGEVYRQSAIFLKRHGVGDASRKWKLTRWMASAGPGLLLTAPGRAQPIWTWKNQYGSVLAVNDYDQSTGAISGTYTNNATNSCDERVPQAMTGWLAQPVAAQRSASQSTSGLRLNDRVDGTTQCRIGFSRALAPLARRALVWNEISAAADAFTFGSGDKSKLISAGKGEAKDGPGEKLSNTKSRK